MPASYHVFSCCQQLLDDVDLGALLLTTTPEEADNDSSVARSKTATAATVFAAATAVLDMPRNWSETLSGGEQQRLGFARLLYHEPAFALLDESTAAMDVALEARCMQLCTAKGITAISVGHRPTLIPFHARVLQLDGKGGYCLISSSDAVTAE